MSNLDSDSNYHLQPSDQLWFRLHHTFLLLLHISFFGHTKVQTHPNLKITQHPFHKTADPRVLETLSGFSTPLSSKTFHSATQNSETTVFQHGQHSRGGCDSCLPPTNPGFEPHHRQNFQVSFCLASRISISQPASVSQANTQPNNLRCNHPNTPQTPTNHHPLSLTHTHPQNHPPSFHYTHALKFSRPSLSHLQPPTYICSFTLSTPPSSPLLNTQAPPTTFSNTKHSVG